MVEKASLTDAKEIHILINKFAQDRLMLPRSLNYVYEHLRDFWVDKEKDRVRGCCSLNIIGWHSLAEIKSLAVGADYQKKGIGQLLIEACLGESRKLGIEKVFVLTYQPDFFRKFGFSGIAKEELPHKIWADCINCPEFPDCKEIALIKKV